LELVAAIAKMMGQVLVETFTSPFFVGLWGMIFWLVFWQNKRQQRLSASFFKDHPDFSFQSALYSTLLGLLGGMAGSILLVFLGVDLGSISITALWVTALLLMLIQPRFICFAYAAGIIAFAHLFFGFPRTSIPQLMGLVAVLHMIESLLILLNGTFHPRVVYVKRYEKLCGGFNLQFFWPIPLLALISVSFPGAAAAGLEMPAWWPLLHDYSNFAGQQALTIVPVIAVLGYGEICTTRTPRQASRRSALLLGIFSLLLLSIALLSSRFPAFLWLAAAFSPLGHELVIWLGMRDESRPPLYSNKEQGLMVMSVVRGSSAERAGIKAGDIIMQANGCEVNSYEDLRKLLKQAGLKLTLLIERSDCVLDLTWHPARNRTGTFVPVPETGSNAYLIRQEDRYFFLARFFWRKLKTLLA
jgi:hypothetical protein